MSQVIGLPDGRQASYEVVGTGRSALMLPGGPGLGAASMRDHAELFADRLESHLIDPHGYLAAVKAWEGGLYQTIDQ
ncbi:MAG TPA: hypothetical protein VGJ44_06800, partial [Kribbellaceae bacterium]